MNSTTGVGETHTNLAIRQTIADGADVGVPIAVPGWTPGSSLKSVIALGAVPVDMTDNFTESETGVGIVGEVLGIMGVEDRGAIDTTGSYLLVLFIAAHPVGGPLTRT